MSGFEVEGLDELRADLSRVLDKYKKAAGDASRETAEQVKETMQSLVRVDTGELRNSIEIDEDGESFLVGPRDDQEEKALANEYGTSRMSAQPFAQPAAEEARNNFPENVKKQAEGI